MTEPVAQPYHRVDPIDWDETYDMLVGPDGFECLLTEPEDRNWFRDGRPVIERLNQQHSEIERLRRYESAYKLTAGNARSVMAALLKLIDREAAEAKEEA